MLRDLRPLRLCVLLLAALQLVLPGAATLAEAHYVGETEHGDHVEADASTCDFLSHPAQCAVSQFLRSPMAEGSTAPQPRPTPERNSVGPGVACCPRESASSFSPLPRSPPSRV